MPEKGELTVREAGRRGGRATKLRHGPEFYESIGRS
jgi:general stress protein YciG